MRDETQPKAQSTDTVIKLRADTSGDSRQQRGSAGALRLIALKFSMQLDAVLSGGDHESAPKTEISYDYVNGRFVEIQQKAERPTGRRKTGFGVSGGKVRFSNRALGSSSFFLS